MDDEQLAEDTTKDCRVYLGNLSWGTDSELLTNFIAEMAALQAAPVSVEIAQTKTGRSLGYAIVTMVNASDAQAVIDNCNEKELDDRSLIVRGDNESPGQKKPKKKRAKKPKAQTGGDSQQQQEQQPVVQEDPAVKACRAYVGNLAWEAEEDALSQFLSAYAAPVSVAIAVTNSGRSLGYAIVTFNSAEEATNIVASCNDLDFGGRPLICREDRESPGGKKKKRKPKKRSVVRITA